MPDKFPQKDPAVGALIKLLNLGSIILLLAIAGFFLDRKFHTLPACTAIGSVLGVLYSFYEAWLIHQGK